MMRWFDALAPRRELTVQMLEAKLYLSHPHHWVPMIFDLSRVVHWFLDAARIALADGAYSPNEMEVLGTVGNALALAPDDTVRLLTSARKVP